MYNLSLRIEISEDNIELEIILGRSDFNRMIENCIETSQDALLILGRYKTEE